MRGRDHPDVHLVLLQRADRTELVLLQQTQQLHLHFERQIADLVEEGCAAIRYFDQAPLGFRRACEGAPGMPEQLAFDQRPDQRTAVDGHKFAGRIGVVDGARHHLLASAAFAQQKDRRAGSSEFFDEPADLADLRRLSHQAVGPAVIATLHGLLRLYRIQANYEGCGDRAVLAANTIGQGGRAVLGRFHAHHDVP